MDQPRLGAAVRVMGSSIAPIALPLPACLRVSLTPRGRSARRIASSNGATPAGDGGAFDEATLWMAGAFPQYLQESVEASDLCSVLEEATVRRDGATIAGEHSLKSSSVWRAICREAEADARAEPLLSSFLYASILSHESFERSIAFVLANRLSDTTLLPTELFEVFYSILKSNRHISEAALADLCAVRERDPACGSYSQALLYFKGFHAIQVQRIAHSLWGRGRRVLALALQSRASEVLAVDIHPAAKLGRGLLLDHGTGVVIGETAEVGNNVSILQNVTLGGTGKEHGDRHPKVSDNVLIGANATVLGNIRIGKGAQVAAGSLVLKPVPPKTMVAGSPAREVGRVSGNPALKMDQWAEGAAKEGTGVVEQQQKTQQQKTQQQEEACEDFFTATPVAAAAVVAPPKAPKQQHPKPHKAKTPALFEDIEVAPQEQEVVRNSDAAVAEVLSASAPALEPKPARDPVAVAEAVRVHKGGPPAVDGPVESVTSDSAAKEKWGSRGSSKKEADDVEYFI